MSLGLLISALLIRILNSFISVPPDKRYVANLSTLGIGYNCCSIKASISKRHFGTHTKMLKSNSAAIAPPQSIQILLKRLVVWIKGNRICDGWRSNQASEDQNSSDNCFHNDWMQNPPVRALYYLVSISASSLGEYCYILSEQVVVGNIARLWIRG